MSHKLIALLFLSSTPAMALPDAPDFTDGEIAQHRAKAGAIAQEAAACLEEHWADHNKFFDEHGFSKFYGNRQQIYSTPDARKLAILKIKHPDLYQLPDDVKAEMVQKKEADYVAQGKDKTLAAVGIKEYLEYLNGRNPGIAAKVKAVATELRDHEAGMKDISCVDLTRRCLGRAFERNGQQDLWKRIDSHVRANGVSGLEMQKSLINLGWTSLYWNPETISNGQWDAEDVVLTPLDPKRMNEKGEGWMPVWGGHRIRCNDVNRKNTYFGVPIANKHTLVNFGIRTPENFKAVPFFVGTAHSAYHVFPGTFGRVIEAHSKRTIASRSNIEFSAFNPYDQVGGGGPRWTDSERYRSGVIVVPPGSLVDQGTDGPIDCGQKVEGPVTVDPVKEGEGQPQSPVVQSPVVVNPPPTRTKPTQPEPRQPHVVTEQEKWERLWSRMSSRQKRDYQRMSPRRQQDFLRRNGINLSGEQPQRKKNIFDIFR